MFELSVLLGEPKSPNHLACQVQTWRMGWPRGRDRNRCAHQHQPSPLPGAQHKALALMGCFSLYGELGSLYTLLEDQILPAAMPKDSLRQWGIYGRYVSMGKKCPWEQWAHVGLIHSCFLVVMGEAEPGGWVLIPELSLGLCSQN